MPLDDRLLDDGDTSGGYHRMDENAERRSKNNLKKSRANKGGYAGPEEAAPELTDEDLEGGGLTTAEANRRFQMYGPNAIEEKPKPWWKDLVPFLVGPMPFMIEAAVITTIATKDWGDFGVLLFLLCLNAGLGYYETKNAGSAIEALKKTLAPVARCKRDGEWNVIEARDLVIGDLVHLKLGDVIPADVKLIHGSHLEIDQAALTGESLPVTKWKNDLAYASSIVKKGEMEAVVAATGRHTFFGKAATLVDAVDATGNLQRVLFKVAMVLITIAVVLVVIIMGVLFSSTHLGLENYWNTPKGETELSYMTAESRFNPSVAGQNKCRGGVHDGAGTVIQLCLVLMVASIPIAMPLVCTATLAVGSRRLAKANAIVTCLSAIEELAGMDVLCSDKTGTLTKNQLTINEPWVADGFTAEDVVFYAALGAKKEGSDAIDSCILEACPNKDFFKKHVQTDFEPFDPVSKRTLAKIRAPDGTEFEVAKGAPQVILDMGNFTPEFCKAVDDAVINFADRGLRPIGVSLRPAGAEWQYVGLISLFDPPRDDTSQTIERAIAMGASVRMITGDHLLIAKETARRIGMGANILGPEFFEEMSKKPDTWIVTAVENADGFAQVFPEHKYQIVEAYKKGGHVTAMTGDGVNDAPALKVADIGIAVEGATDAARAASDIVLLSPGLSTIITAMIRSRKIFQRVKNYVTYRISASTQVLLFVFIGIIFLKGPNPCVDSAGLIRPLDTVSSTYQAQYVQFVQDHAPSILGMPGDCVVTQNNDVTISNSSNCSPFAVNFLHYKHSVQCNALSEQCGWTCPNKYSDSAPCAGACTPCIERAFRVPAIVLILIVILNDGTITAIAYDKVIPGPTPEKWIMWQIALIGVVNGLIGVLQTWLNFHLASTGEFFFSKNMTDSQVKVVVYLSLSFSGQLSVFICRTRGFFFSRRPGYVLLSSVSFASVISLIFSLTWFLGGGMEKIDFKNCMAVWVIVLGFFVICDIVKVTLYNTVIPKANQGDYKQEKQAEFRRQHEKFALEHREKTY